MGNKIIIANWKMNPQTLAEAQELFDFYLSEISKYQNINLVVCPSFVYLEELSKQLLQWASLHKDAHCSLGAQDLFWEKSGPYTGEISTDMLKNFGVTHVLVGHSDRRYKIGLPSTTSGSPEVVLGESDEVINKKIKAALDADIVPVLLVGERNRTDDRKKIITDQLSLDLAGLTPDQIGKILITYEPVWAISTTPGSEPDTSENTQQSLEIIKEFLATNFQFPISNFELLYGGSIDSKNIADFLKHPEISGAVIGGASLRKEEFGNILKIVSNL